MRKTKTISYRDWTTYLDGMDSDARTYLRLCLLTCPGGNVCDYIEVDVDSHGRIDSESNPRPGHPSALDRSAAETARETDGMPPDISFGVANCGRCASYDSLLEACKSVLDTLDRNNVPTPHYLRRDEATIRAAIAQATGEEVKP